MVDRRLRLAVAAVTDDVYDDVAAERRAYSGRVYHAHDGRPGPSALTWKDRHGLALSISESESAKNAPEQALS